MQVESKAKLRYLRTAPRKVRLLIDLIRGLPVEQARVQLQYSKKDAARPVLKLLNSAIANAVNNENAKEETLIVKEAFVDGGPVLKRWRPRAFGRASSIKKRTSHVTIVVSGEGTKIEKEVKNEKVEDKKEDKKQEKVKGNKKVDSEKKSVKQVKKTDGEEKKEEVVDNKKVAKK